MSEQRTYGACAYRRKSRTWAIECEPHVTMMLKRVFAGMAKGRTGVIKVSDTKENARNLDWFMSRYPLRMRREDRAHLTQRASDHKETSNLVDALMAGRVQPEPFELAVPAREYQKVAASILLKQGHLLLTDDVGLGKTTSAICALSDPRTRPALVVTLTHLPKQWQREIGRFAPNLTTHILEGTKPYDLTGRGAQLGLPGVEKQFPDVVITSYSKLSGWGETLSKCITGAVIFDEVQELRRATSGRELTQKFAAARLVTSNAKFRMGLSATPIYGYGAEMFNVMQIIAPGALGSKSEFSEGWCSSDYGDRIPRIVDPRAFGSFMRESGLMLRRTRKDVGRELPALQSVPHYVDCDRKALDQIASSAADLARIILGNSKSNVRGEKMMASEELSNKLRQATGIAKAPYVADFVQMLAESGEKVVVFAWHRSVYDLLMDRLRPFEPRLYTGSESAAQKDEARTAFIEGKAKILLMSLRSGAGLDGLQRVCRTVVFAELDWSPGIHEQCAGRIYRDGQPDPVVAYYLLADEGSDPIVSEVLGIKRAQIEGVRDPSLEFVEKLQADTDHVKRLAADFLRQRGLKFPDRMREAS